MSSSTVDGSTAAVSSVHVDDEILRVGLTDGRTLSAPIGWYPRLVHGSSDERNDWRVIGGGRGIHWPSLD